jgi:hypothetical protein
MSRKNVELRRGKGGDEHVAEEKGAVEARLSPELMVEVCRALNFDPSEFAKRHGEEFTHLYLRADGMLSHVGEEIVSYLAKRVNECLSKAEYALLSYIEYAGRSPRVKENDRFSEAVAHYLRVRKKTGGGWVYAFEGEGARDRCLAAYPQMCAVARAMYKFAQETEEFKEIAGTDGPGAWPDPRKVGR